MNRHPFRATTVVGNPLSPSRTRVAADHFSAVLGELAPGRPEPVAEAALDALCDADLVLAVTPIHKGTCTGLLEILFDGPAGEALPGKVAVPVVVGAWPAVRLLGGLRTGREATT